MTSFPSKVPLVALFVCPTRDTSWKAPPDTRGPQAGSSCTAHAFRGVQIETDTHRRTGSLDAHELNADKELRGWGHTRPEGFRGGEYL